MTEKPQVPEEFRFGLKVTDTITIKKFPKLDRFGDLAGKHNENFLNAELFVTSFLEPCRAIRSRVGLLIFEFSRFWPVDYQHGRDFLADLDQFLGRLPNDWPMHHDRESRRHTRPSRFARSLR